MWIVTYGSLLNRNEFTCDYYKLVSVQGWKRVFNRLATRSVWRGHIRGNEKAALSVIPSVDSSFNAVLYNVTSQQFNQLVKRENGYRTELAEVFHFQSNEFAGVHPLFVSNEFDKDGVKVLRSDIKPIRRYLEVCRSGAYSWGDDFGKAFDRTTFLADGKTTCHEHVNRK
jgi:hypothetical protein